MVFLEEGEEEEERKGLGFVGLGRRSRDSGRSGKVIEEKRTKALCEKIFVYFART